VHSIEAPSPDPSTNIAEAVSAVDTWDAEQRTLILANGQTYILPEGQSIEDLQTGDAVHVVYDDYENVIQSLQKLPWSSDAAINPGTGAAPQQGAM